MKRTLAVSLVVLALVASACDNDKDKEADEGPLKACGPAPALIVGRTNLPTGFPTPGPVKYTSSKSAGPSTIVSGFYPGDLDAAFDGYKNSFDGTSFKVTDSEKDPRDAEVNFSGSGGNGQVKLEEQCDGRVDVTITVRPS